MKIESQAFGDNQIIPTRYTCDGENVNPPLVFSGVPNEARSLVLIMDDPDAPRGTWTHWILWNIPPDTKEIPEHSLPQGGVEGVTSFGETGYGGPCPHSGTHRYFFKLYAIDNVLTLSAEATKSDLEREIDEHIILKAELTGLYSRP